MGWIRCQRTARSRLTQAIPTNRTHDAGLVSTTEAKTRQTGENEGLTQRKPTYMRRWVKRVGFGIAGLGLAAAAFVGVATLRTKLPVEEVTPAGIRQSSSMYVKMRDGVEIAVTIDLPPDLKPGDRVPVLMRTTRYWREPQIGWTRRKLGARDQ